jgi:ubiquinone/menaquinone biosynthesis C-methylase UbiE
MQQPSLPGGFPKSMSEKRLSEFTDVDRSANPRKFVEHLCRGARLEYHRRVKLECAALLALEPGECVLDVGCGIGDTLTELARAVGPTGRAVGLDSSTQMLAEARRRAEEAGLPIEYVLGDVRDLAFEDESFDAVQAAKLFVHLRAPELAMDEMVRVTRSGGRVLVFELDADTMLVNAPDKALTRKILDFLSDHFANGLAGRKLNQLMLERGLGELQIVPETLVLRDLATAEPYWTFRSTARRAAEAGVLTHGEAERWIQELEALDQAGLFFNALTAFIVCGRKR